MCQAEGPLGAGNREGLNDSDFGKAGVESPRHRQQKERGREGQGTFQILTESWADVHNITLRR